MPPKQTGQKREREKEWGDIVKDDRSPPPTPSQTAADLSPLGMAAQPSADQGGTAIHLYPNTPSVTTLGNLLSTSGLCLSPDQRSAYEAELAKQGYGNADELQNARIDDLERWGIPGKNARAIYDLLHPNPNANAAGVVAAVLPLIDPSSVYQPKLTATDLAYQPQGGALSWVIDKIKKMHDAEEFAKMSWGKGQPVVGTGATSGVGKSRLLEEIRSHYINSNSAHVFVVSYNTHHDLAPTSAERNGTTPADRERATSCFRSRLLCAMLPPGEVMKAGPPRSQFLSTRFEKVTDDDVVDVLAAKFSDGKDVLILVDEVAQLSEKTAHKSPPDDTVMHAVISALGDICHHASHKLAPSKCVGIFTALGKRLVVAARTNSGRNILIPPLPLLSRKEVASVVRAKHHNASDLLIDHVYAITAGHARTLEKMMDAEWKDDHLNQAIENLIPSVCNQSSRFVVTEPELRAILLEDSTAGVDFQQLSRESILHMSTSGGAGEVTIVPAFLYKWCLDNPKSPLAQCVKASLDAAWERIYQEGKDGNALERFWWTFEAVRRELVGGAAMTPHDFFQMKKVSESWKWLSEYKFATIKRTKQIPPPSSNKRENVDVVATVVQSGTRYEPTSENSPKYDWLTAVEDATGELVPMGFQTKHGEVQNPDSQVVSVKISTLDAGMEDWSAKGWLVLHDADLRCFLGSSMTAAASALLHHPAN